MVNSLVKASCGSMERTGALDGFDVVRLRSIAALAVYGDIPEHLVDVIDDYCD